MTKKSVAEINIFLNNTKESTQNFLNECSENQRIAVLSSVIAQVLSIGFSQKSACSCPPKSLEVVKKDTPSKPAEKKKPTVFDPYGFAAGSTAAKINKLITGKPKSKQFLAKKLNVSVSAITQHLQNLKKKDAPLEVEKRGVAAYYSLPVIQAENTKETEGQENE